MSAMYAELTTTTNFSFLTGASHPEEFVLRAMEYGYEAIAITDECSVAGVVKAFDVTKEYPGKIKLIIGSRFLLDATGENEKLSLVLLAPDRAAYAEMSAFITLGRRRCSKGNYQLSITDLLENIRLCLVILTPAEISPVFDRQSVLLTQKFHGRLWVGLSLIQECDDYTRFLAFDTAARKLGVPLTACGDVHMHSVARKPLLDVVTAIRLIIPVQQLGRLAQQNAGRSLRPVNELQKIYPPALLQETLSIAGRCTFTLGELKYEYPPEIMPPGREASEFLAELTWQGAARRWPGGTLPKVKNQILAELALIKQLKYEHFFLTVYDVVCFARSRHILCQGRGSAANSAVCYCLGITEVDPAQSELLFERFLSRERNEPPDIDVDFEHERREEVIQYIYTKYGRDRAALAATVITYRTRSALRDVGKALGLDAALLDHLAKSMAWWDKPADLVAHLSEAGIAEASALAQHLLTLLHEIRRFPRHLSQHVGGFVISCGPVSELVPVENAAMADRSVIQWDKDDLESLGLLKVDVLALGMLTAIRKSLGLVSEYTGQSLDMAAIPKEDPQVYNMLCRADSVGVFQIESRAQMAMLPRLRPRNFYDLVVQVAIVRPGPIQGGMVGPYLDRRNGKEKLEFPSEAVRGVLERTYGVPIFQEQVIKMTMVAAGFSGGEADQLRRAMASWKKNGKLGPFEKKLKQGMAERGYESSYADRLWNQILGFGEYGFPESHAASFALLVYVSAWLKHHHPAAFCCGLLNSLPMGFYSPSQLIQDAARHGIEIRPVRVERSSWDHTLEPGSGTQPAVRLGMRLVAGFNAEAASRLMAARQESPICTLQDIKERALLSSLEMESLIAADALATLSGHRPQSQWEAAALAPVAPLLSALERADSTHLHDGIQRPAPDICTDVLGDYASTGLSLKAHPMSLLRKLPQFARCTRAVDLLGLPHGRLVYLAGVVTGRQRPGTANGIIFMTLEDETGNINVVIHLELQQRCRKALLGSHLALIKGAVEKRENVVHVVAGHIENISHALREFVQPSRDFH